MKAPTIQVEVAGLPKVQQFAAAVAALIRSLDGCQDLPQPVMDAADQVRRVAAEMGSAKAQVQEGA